MASEQRNKIRAALFSSSNRKSVRFTLYGQEIELKQPSLGDVMKAQEHFDKDRGGATAEILIRHCYVPGTNELIFDEADRDSILNMPVGNDLLNLNKAVVALLGIGVEEAEKNSVETQGDITSTP